MTISDVINYFSSYSFDIRISKNGRFMDQKCTPDVVCAVSECILCYTEAENDKAFTKDDIWYSKEAEYIIQAVFSKPNLTNQTVSSEYDKFFAQPLKLLSAAHILDEKQVLGKNQYTIIRRDILEFISQRERSAYEFLYEYLNKTIIDSGLQAYFDNYFSYQDRASLYELREKLNKFYFSYTKISNSLEPPRIYNKIINILAYKKKALGTSGGGVSKGIITFNEITYNRANWRDIKKDRSVSRQEYLETIENEINSNKDYFKYQVEKAKQLVRKIEPFSEIHPFPSYPGLQAHHIFMASEFPDLADSPENIISLTPDQHFQKAHPMNNTSIVDKDYQILCLISKLNSIERDLNSGNRNYDIEDFKLVLNTGFDTDLFSTYMSFEDIKYNIMKVGIQRRNIYART